MSERVTGEPRGGGTRLAPSLLADPVAVDRMPVVDFAPFRTGDGAARKQAALDLAAAFHNIGFCYLAGHGVPQQLMDATFAESRRFFALPREAKEAVAVTRSVCDRGWFDLGMENLDPEQQKDEGDLKEGYRIGNDLPLNHPLVRAGLPFHGPNQWPTEPAAFRSTLEEYYAALRGLAGQVTHAIAVALELPEDYFDAWFTHPMVILSPLHYPPQRVPDTGEITEARIGAGAHSDYGCVTLLAQDDRGGLQVRNAAGRWIGAMPIPGTFVVNLGDMLARWTNDLFPATLHRVVNASGADRYSIPFFFDPNHDAPVECIPTCLREGERPKYPPTTSLAHLTERFAATLPYLEPAPASGGSA
jgi:isopenicillin N synthase-like dioxygenase